MLEVQEVELSKLKPWEHNPRVNDQAVDAVAKSIQAFGFNVPILYDQNYTIIAGHTRWKAAKKLGMTYVPAIQIKMTDSQRKAFSIADNKLASVAGWDNELVAQILEELKLDEFDLSSLGYSEAELDALLAQYQDFNWDEFKEYLKEEVADVFAILQIKIKAELKAVIQNAIKKYAIEHNIKENDSALLAGKVVCGLLGVRQ